MKQKSVLFLIMQLISVWYLCAMEQYQRPSKIRRIGTMPLHEQHVAYKKLQGEDVVLNGNLEPVAQSERGKYPVIEELLKAGADPERANAEGVTPLLAALKSGDKEVMRVILRAIDDKYK